MRDDFSPGDWSTLEPTPSQRRKIERRVFDWLDVNDASITAEWLQIIRVEPIAGLGYAAAAALTLLLLSPVGWLVTSVLRQLAN